MLIIIVLMLRGGKSEVVCLSSYAYAIYLSLAAELAALRQSSLRDKQMASAAS